MTKLRYVYSAQHAFDYYPVRDIREEKVYVAVRDREHHSGVVRILDPEAAQSLLDDEDEPTPAFWLLFKELHEELDSWNEHTPWLRE